MEPDLPEAALLQELGTYRTTRRGGAGESEHHSLRSSVWKQTDGRWQMVFRQDTRTLPRHSGVMGR